MTWSHIVAIAWLTVRDAVRSRLLVSLAAILVTGLVSLPLLISGGNALNGQVQIILKYTLAFATAMLSAVTLWAACAGLSSEIQDRRLYLVLTKPVYRHELWLGKWLGIVGLNAMLLALTGLIIRTMVWHTIQASPESDAVKHQVREKFSLARVSVLPDPNTGGHFAIPPAGILTLDFTLPAPATGEHDLILDYAFDSSRPERTPVAAEWHITQEGGAPRRRGGESAAPEKSGIAELARPVSLSVTNYPGLPCSIVIPDHVLAGAARIKAIYRRKDPGNPAMLMMTSRGTGPELLVPTGGGGMNLVRALLIILCRLAFLAALGLTAGSLLSLPVALFVAVFVMTVLALSGYVDSVASSGVYYVPHEGPDLTKTWLDIQVLRLFKVFNVATQPFLRFDPVPLIEEGRLIGWGRTAQAFMWLAGLYTALTALIGITLFNQRELG